MRPDFPEGCSGDHAARDHASPRVLHFYSEMCFLVLDLVNQVISTVGLGRRGRGNCVGRLPEMRSRGAGSLFNPAAARAAEGVKLPQSWEDRLCP